ncbi:MAG: hypothetical protein O2916_10770 [Proteobacteria bacterium]|nr:hypothetical protein [Pseudomonadota bacterium]
MRKPFNLFADLATCQEWLPTLDVIRTQFSKEVLLLVTNHPAQRRREI